jgi:hypothetical protein
MNAKTLKALKASIKHWHENATTAEPIYFGTSHCALCELFFGFFIDDNRCFGCPVFKKTGLTNCRGTPWRKMYEHKGKRKHESPRGLTIINPCPTCRAIAAKEEAFLKSLLPISVIEYEDGKKRAK